MAKRHDVKCLYCGQIFDANTVPFVMPRSNRYAHKTCQEDKLASETKQEHDKRVLEEYIKELFGYTILPVKVTKTIQSLVHDTTHNYTYSGILKSLKYFYEVKKNPLDKANGNVGIVKYIYEDAYKYWYAIWEAQQKNEVVDMQEYLLPTREVHIIPPQREPMRRARPQFTFLEEEVVGD